MKAFTWNEVWAMRLTRHSLLTPAPMTCLADIAGAVCGIHAQVMPAAELSLGIRVAGVTRQNIRSEFRERRDLVKTYGIPTKIPRDRRLRGVTHAAGSLGYPAGFA